MIGASHLLSSLLFLRHLSLVDDNSLVGPRTSALAAVVDDHSVDDDDAIFHGAHFAIIESTAN